MRLINCKLEPKLREGAQLDGAREDEIGARRWERARLTTSPSVKNVALRGTAANTVRGTTKETKRKLSNVRKGIVGEKVKGGGRRAGRGWEGEGRAETQSS